MGILADSDQIVKYLDSDNVLVGTNYVRVMGSSRQAYTAGPTLERCYCTLDVLLGS